MAEASSPPKVKLICGMISARRELFDTAAECLARHFGPADVVSDVMDFDFTHYYDEKMGLPLYRKFIAFDALISPETLIDVKCLTNQLEREFATAAKGQPARPINLDPGYIESSKLILASMKNFSHRIYLNRGVYAEVTLMYHKGEWCPLKWTFPDYASPRYHGFLTEARRRMREQLSEI